MSSQKQSLAVIGTGLAGLSAAFLLKDKFEVSVFEGQARAGMGVHTVDYRSRGADVRIDVPLRIFCKGYYRNLTALYEHIGVTITGSDHSGIFADGNSKPLFHYGKFSLKGISLPYPKGSSLFSINTLKIGYQLRRFFKRASRDLTKLNELKHWDFDRYLKESETSSELTELILLPILAVTLTCDYQSVLNYPAELILEYLCCGIAKDGIIGAEKGVDDIVPRLIEGVELNVNCRVSEITQDGKQLRVSYGDEQHSLFDHVVIASQAQQAIKMLKGFVAQQVLLQTVPFEKSEMSVHSDTSLLPKSVCTPSPVSYHIPNKEQRPEVTVNLTQAFERYQHTDPVFQTWNPLREPAAGTEVARVPFTRPVVTLESRKAMAELRTIQSKPNNQLWFCGSYVADKVPLLDAAVNSSILVAKHLGVSIPWQDDE